MSYDYINVVVGDSREFPAIDTGERWNGWVVPAFELGTMAQLAEHFRDGGPATLEELEAACMDSRMDPDWEGFVIDAQGAWHFAQGDVYHGPTSAAVFPCERRSFSTADGPKIAWVVPRSWCWEPV